MTDTQIGQIRNHPRYHAASADVSAERARLAGRPTRYELVAQHDETRERVLILYSAGKTRGDIIGALCGDAIMPAAAAFFGTREYRWLKFAREGLVIGKWRVWFSGRTQRESIGSELVWIVDAVSPAKLWEHFGGEMAGG